MASRKNANIGQKVRVDIYSRPNSINGKYRAAHIGLDDYSFSKVKDTDAFFWQTLQMKANLADKMIAEAEAQGEDTSDPGVIKKLGEEINSIGTPVHRSSAITTAIINSTGLIIIYALVVGVWGLALGRNFWLFSLWGAIGALIISSFMIIPQTGFQRTSQNVKNMSQGSAIMLITPAIIAGIVGVIVLIVRFILK